MDLLISSSQGREAVTPEILGGGLCRMPGTPPVLFLPDERTARRFWEFFAANISNHNTRRAYFGAAGRFSAWCLGRRLTDLAAVQPVHVAAWLQELGRDHSRPTVKQHLAAIRILFDWLIVGQIV